MEHNSLGPGVDISRRVGVVFEGLLASPPNPPRFKLFKQPDLPALYLWRLNDKPYRSLRRMDSQLVPYEIYTLVNQHDEDWLDKIDGWLNRANVFPYTVLNFTDPMAMAKYLLANLEVYQVYVPTTDLAVSPRCTVVTDETELRA